MEQQGVSARRVAFFGGSFDPPHRGHLAIAQAALTNLALDMVLFAPVGHQPLKPKGSTASFEDRMAMTRLAIAGHPGFVLSAIDAPKQDGRPNYTVETLAQLKAQEAVGALFFLMGADSFLNLKSWHRAAEIPFLAPLIVAFRPGESMEDVRAALPNGLTLEAMAGKGAEKHSGTSSAVDELELKDTAGQTTPLFLLPGLQEDVSASQIRALVRGLARSDGSDFQDPKTATSLLPSPVLTYIREHKLYR